MNYEPFALSLVKGFALSDRGFDRLSPSGK